MSDEHVYTIAIFQGYLLSWEKSNIQNLLRNYYHTLKSIDEIAAIIQTNQKLIQNYKDKITSGNAKIHQRVRLYAKQHNLNSKININNSSENSLIISRLIGIILNYNKISYQSLISTYNYEFNPNDNIVDILPTLEIFRYENKNNYFQRLNNSLNNESTVYEAEVKNNIFKIIYNKNTQVHINDTNKEIFLHDKFTSIKFLYYCFELQEKKSDPGINAFIKEVKGRL